MVEKKLKTKESKPKKETVPKKIIKVTEKQPKKQFPQFENIEPVVTGPIELTVDVVQVQIEQRPRLTCGKCGSKAIYVHKRGRFCQDCNNTSNFIN